MKSLAYSPLVIILVLTSCLSRNFQQEKHRTIKLKGLPENSITLNVENEKVHIKFGVSDLLNIWEVSHKMNPNSLLNEEIQKLKTLNSDLLFNEDEWKGNLIFSFYEHEFHELLKSGKAEVWERKSGNRLNRIKYTFSKNKLGDEHATFSYIGGEEFYTIILAFGE